MNKSLFKKLLTSYIVIIIITLLAVGIILSKLFLYYYLSTKEVEMVKKGKEAAEMIIKYEESNMGIKRFPPTLDHLLQRLSGFLDASLFIINENGEVTAASTETVPKGTFLSAAEIEKVLSGQIITWKGSSPHFENTMLSVAIPLKGKEKAYGTLLVNTSVTGLSVTLNSLHRMIIYAALSAIILAIVIGYFLSKSISKPIRDISNITVEMAKGNFKQKVTINSKDEIGQLASNFNHLAANLDQTVNALSKEKKTIENILRNMAEGVLAIDEKGKIILLNSEAELTLGIKANQVMERYFKDLLELKDLADILTRVLTFKRQESVEITLNNGKKYILAHASPLENEQHKVFGVVAVLQDITELRQLELLRRDFVANVSHELRTPLTSIRAFLEVLMEGVIEDEPTKQRYLYSIHEETLRLDRLIHDLLDLALIESGKIKWDLAEFNLMNVIKLVKMQLQHLADNRKVDIKINDDIDQLVVKGNVDRIQQVLINLISNGIQFSPYGSEIKINVKKEKEQVIVEITDNGPGISEEDTKRIWERFYRVEKSRSRNKGGTGLGLAIVKLIVEAHGGSVGVKSIPNEGSTFYFSLPQ